MKKEKNAVTLGSRRVSRLNLMLKCVLGMAILMIAYFMVYHNVYVANYSDVSSHVRDAMEINRHTVFKEFLTGQDVLWHTIVKLLYEVKGLSRYESACIVTSVVYTSYYFLCCAVMERELDLPDGVIPVACFVVCIVSPLYAPWFSKSIYLGQGSPNPWHSPTQIMVKPFALLVFTMTALIYNRMRNADGSWNTRVYLSRREAAVYTILIALSEYAKPCCFQIMVPGLGMLMVIDLVRSRGKSLLFSVKMAAAFVPAAVLTAMKFVTAFYMDEGGGGVEIAPFVVWGHYTKNIAFSIFLMLAFPLFVFIMDRRNYLKTAEYPLSVTVLISGTLMRLFLAEKGRRRWHGNFGWGYGLACTLIWFVALKRFLRMMTSDELSEGEYRIAAIGGYCLLALHFFCGIVYLIYLGTTKAQC